ncbi:MAG: hypothetical protein IJV67_05565 [Clostridia bacterium]|nr:hypothetical protein [Clostridia bacterium]
MNDTLTRDEIFRQVKMLYEGGFGGAYIHCRSGYTGEYLTEQWFSRCDDLIDAMEQYGLEPWIYDEFGWPSGIAGGYVIKKDKTYCQHWLVKNTEPKNPKGEVVGYYNEKGEVVDKEVAFFSLESVLNSSYVDVLNKTATELFIQETHEKYRQRYGNRIKGFFTDEPQYGLDHAPWSADIIKCLKEKYGDYISLLPFLYTEDGGDEFRLFFNKVSAQAFRENYISPISKWCDKFGYLLTGHILEEKELWLQIPSAGDVMGIYKEMQTPAIDWLGSDIGDMKTPKQLSSVCQRYEKQRCVSESFALIGYGASFDIMKNVSDWQIAGGVSNICNVMAYSLRGRRKRDYPAGLAFCQPYYKKAKAYNEHVAKLCTIPATMREVADVLLVEPLYEGMSHYVYGRRFNVTEGCKRASEAYNDAIGYLTENNVLFHVASPSELRDAKAVDGGLQLGSFVYKTVISLDDFTDGLLADLGVEFVKTPQNAQKRLFLHGAGHGIYTSVYSYGDGFAIILKNLTDEGVCVDDVTFDGKAYSAEVDLDQMRLTKPSKIFIPAKGLKVLLTDEVGEGGHSQTEYQTLEISNDGFEYKPLDKNLLVLDFCSFETEEERGRSSVMRLFEKLVSDAYSGKLKMEFMFENRGISDSEADLLVETPEMFSVSFNGEKAIFNCNAARIKIKEGINTVTLVADYSQDEKSRRILNGEAGAEVDFNMLGKLFELENIYIRGNFGVFADDAKICGSMLEATQFYLADANNAGGCNNAAKNGYPYYAGAMQYEKQIRAQGGDAFIKMHNICGAADVYLDGILLKTVLWNEGKIPVFGLKDGEHTLRIVHYNTVRNAIGPNHNIYDEGIMVGYTTFSDQPGWCDRQGKGMWTDTYRLALYGVDFEK